MYKLSKNKFKGFTLSEVLITLGIIGIVAAMTIPTLVIKYRKNVLHKQLLKTYSELSQVNTRIIANGDNLLDTASVEERAELIMKYFNGKAIIDPNSDWETAKAKLTKLYKGKGLYSFSGKSNNMHPICDNSKIYIDITGRLWLFNDSDRQICVDINGTKAPNRIGYDYFIFYPDKTNGEKIIPHGTKSDEFYTGYTPTYYAVYNISPNDSTKTYWEDYLPNSY